eukprot:13726727-Heterocapsa_arctica.AAC.1
MASHGGHDHDLFAGAFPQRPDVRLPLPRRQEERQEGRPERAPGAHPLLQDEPRGTSSLPTCVLYPQALSARRHPVLEGLRDLLARAGEGGGGQ